MSLFLNKNKNFIIIQEENRSLKSKLEEAAIAMSELNQIVAEVKEEYSKLADEKKLNESILEAKIKEKGKNYQLKNNYKLLILNLFIL